MLLAWFDGQIRPGDSATLCALAAYPKVRGTPTCNRMSRKQTNGFIHP